MLLDDVSLAGPTDGQMLVFNNSNQKWVSKTPVDSYPRVQTYSRTETDTLVSNVLLGLEHGVAVQTIANDPPATPVADEVYIVGTIPTGTWVGHAGELALWDGKAWVFSTPQDREAHLVEDETATYSWNGTIWVKVATASAGGVATNVPLYQFRNNENTTETQHEFFLGNPAQRYAELKGIVQATVDFAPRPWLKFGTTVFDLTQPSKFGHVAALADYGGAGIADQGVSFINNHKTGMVFLLGTYQVKAGNTFPFTLHVIKKSSRYWEVSTDAFYISANSTPMRMTTKYEVFTDGLGDLTGIGVACYDATGATLIGSSYALNVESM
jgi:hypothetical protein